MRNSMPILLVEDEPTGVILVKRALKNSDITNSLVHSINCKEALEYLNDQNNKKHGFILLNLNTPETNSFEFLRVVKADSILSQILVIVPTGSDNEQDIAESFKLGAAGYMVKPAQEKL